MSTVTLLATPLTTVSPSQKPISIARRQRQNQAEAGGSAGGCAGAVVGTVGIRAF
jgi:hypothetical protein